MRSFLLFATILVFLAVALLGHRKGLIDLPWLTQIGWLPAAAEGSDLPAVKESLRNLHDGNETQAKLEKASDAKPVQRTRAKAPLRRKKSLKRADQAAVKPLLQPAAPKPKQEQLADQAIADLQNAQRPLPDPKAKRWLKGRQAKEFIMNKKRHAQGCEPQYEDCQRVETNEARLAGVVVRNDRWSGRTADMVDGNVNQGDFRQNTPALYID